MIDEKFLTSSTICWDCKKAIGGCSWSNYFIPVKGWTAKPTTKTGGIASYLVIDCPSFERDSIGYGLKRIKKEKQ